MRQQPEALDAALPVAPLPAESTPNSTPEIFGDTTPGAVVEAMNGRIRRSNYAIPVGVVISGGLLAIEENLFALYIASGPDLPLAGDHRQIADAIHMAQAFAEQPIAFDRLTMYEQRIRRCMERNLTLLETARQERMAAEAKGFEEGRLLLQSTRHNKGTFDPAAELS